MSERKNILWLIALGVVGFLTYYSGIDIPYYADDFLFLSDSSCSGILDRFLGKGRGIRFYRPIEAAFLACVQENFGRSTIPIHVATIFLHVLLSYLVFVLILKVGFSRLHAILGSLFMLVSQANTSAVLGNDTFSQTSGTFFGYLSLWLLYSSFPESEFVVARNANRPPRFWRYCLSLLTFAVALFSKETSVSFLPLVLGVLLIKLNGFRRKVEKSALQKTFVTFLPFLLVMSGYVISRSFVGAPPPTLGSGRYNFAIGPNILENLLMLFVASIIPVSSVTVFTSIKSGQVGILTAIAVASFLFLVVSAYGLWRRCHLGIVLVIGASALGTFFPVVMLNHVSELYAYNAMPFFAAIFGISFGNLLEQAKERWSEYAIAAMLCLLFGSHVIAIQNKASLMQENGARAEILLQGIKPYAEKVSHGGELLLVNPESNQPEYSIFLIRDFNLFLDGASIIKKRSNRQDITVRIIEQKDLQQTYYNTREAVILSLEGDFVKPVKQDDSVRH